MFNLKIANIERLLKQRNNSEIIQNTSQEIADYINSICQDNKKCEQYYFQQILKLGKNDSITLENIKNIKYQDIDKISIKEEYKIFIDKLSREIRGFNKIPNLQEWVIKQLPNVLVEDYNEFFVDIKTFAGLQDDERFQHKDITKISSPKELRQIIIPFVRSEITTTTNNKEWKGEWIYNKDEVSIFKSYDPETISQISKKYQTRWCIKDPDVAKDTYECETQPMYFVFIGDNVVCVIHLETNQIKDVADLALSDISIIKKIDPVLQELNLTTAQRDFITYYKILNRSKEISSKLDSLDQPSKIKYAKKLLLEYINDINSIDKNLIIYNKELQDVVVEKISDNLNRYLSIGTRAIPPLTISQDLYLSIPRIREIYLKFWEEATKDDVYFYVQDCPSYIGKEKVIQDSFIIGMENMMKKDALNYLSFKGSYPEIINRHMDKFKQYINPCVERMKEETAKNPNRHIQFQKSKEKIPEIFNNPEIVKSFEEAIVTGIENKIKENPINYVILKIDFQEIMNRNMEQFKQYINPCIESIKHVIIYNQTQYDMVQESKKYNPEIFNNIEVVKGVEESVMHWVKNKIIKSPSHYENFKKDYPEIFNNPNLVKGLEEALIIGIKNKLNEDILDYSFYKGIFPDIFNNPEIVKSFEESFVSGIKKQTEEKADFHYSYYKENFPELFNNPEIVKSFQESLVIGIKNKIIKNPLNYEVYKKRHPELFNNPETVKGIEKSLVIGIKNGIIKKPELYSDYQKEFPEIFEKYITPNKSEQSTTSNNWYKLFKSSQKNRISI